MKSLLTVYYILLTPLLAIMYWRNNLREIDDVHAISFNIEVE